MKSLDAKLSSLHDDPGGAQAFILADAKDADMAFGLAAPGVDYATGRSRSLADYRDQIREIVGQGLVDIMLMSPSTSALLTVEEQLFEGSAVTPAVRGNDTTDIHMLAGARYPHQPSNPLRTASMGEVASAGVDLALYSITPANDARIDVAALTAYREFRSDAAGAGVRHFLEVFGPNIAEWAPEDPGRFLNDFVVRTLAGITAPNRPLLLKLPYHGAARMQELAAYDPHLIPGIMGGASGTTYDAFSLLEDARRNGARAALFGRKIKDSEHPLTFVRHLRHIADGELSAQDAVHSYHGELDRLGIRPARPLEQDLQSTTNQTGAT